MENKTRFSLHTLASAAGFAMIGAALLLSLYLGMCLLGLIHPRTTTICIYTPDLRYTYDEKIHTGSNPKIVTGQLREGHQMVVRTVLQESMVGVYENAPQICILDSTGADVTKQYRIITNFGTMEIAPRALTLYCHTQQKLYDGEPLSCGDVLLPSENALLEGHALVQDGGNSIITPGSVKCAPSYRIEDAQGNDVTDCYDIYEKFGELVVSPIDLFFTTGSAQKSYDGTPLTCEKWNQIGGNLLPGHSLSAETTGRLEKVGTIENPLRITVTDRNGTDVTGIYRANVSTGSLTVQALPLTIQTADVTEIYNGQYLQCERWKLVSGELPEAFRIVGTDAPTLQSIGSLENNMCFSVLDDRGIDVTENYSITVKSGILTLQPRAITVQTGSAKYIYDGGAKSCNDFSVIAGTLAEGDQIEFYGTLIEQSGICDNVPIQLVVYRTDTDGTKVDVTAFYRISYVYGKLEMSTG